MANVFQVKDSEVFAQHRANIMASLSHRLEVARNTHNTQLIHLLEQEQRQLSSPHLLNQGTPILEAIQHWWGSLTHAIASASSLTVQQMWDEQGNLWWYAHDPISGMSLYAETEAEVVTWIEDNYLGR